MADDTKLEIKRTLNAAPSVVFQAWTKPDVLTRWMAPGPLSCPSATVDLRVGGAYRFEMREPGGDTHVAVGAFKEIVEDQKLVMSWSWEGGSSPESLLTIELAPSGSGTDLTLTHERLGSAEEARKHTEGWMGCLQKLEGLLAA